MTNRFCCCNESCTIGIDIFDDPGTLATDWTQQSGTWSISGSSLNTNYQDARIRYNKEHPETIKHHIVLTTISFTQEGDKARIFFGTSLIFELEYRTYTYLSGTNYTLKPCTIARLFVNGIQVDEEKYLAYKDDGSIAVGYNEEEGIFWAEVEQRINMTAGFGGWQNCNTYWDYLLQGTLNLTAIPFLDCTKCLGKSLSSNYLSSAFSNIESSAFSFSRGIDPQNITVGAFSFGTGDTVNGTVSFTQMHYLKGKTTVLEQCPTYCLPELEEDTCFISEGPCVPVKNNLVSSDLKCVGDYTIASGTWDGVDLPTIFPFRTFCYLLQTSTSGALIEFNSEQSDYFEHGAVSVSSVFILNSTGDTFRVYVDYESSLNSHYVDFVCGDVNGIGSAIEVYKNGTLLDSVNYPSVIMHPGDLISGLVCSASNPFDEGVDTVSGILHTQYDSFGNVTGVGGQVVAATTLIGNKKAAFGSGSLSGNLICHIGSVLENGDDCFYCYGSTCPPCPGNIGVTNGLSIIIDGLEQASYYNPCSDCTEMNGTYLREHLPNTSCGSLIENMYICTVGTGFGKTDVYFGVGWGINTVIGSTDWKLTVTLSYTFDRFYRWKGVLARYSKVFPITQNCFSITDELLTFEEIIYGPGTISHCKDWENLTVKVSAY